ncbi:MAG TPA: septum formation initiator family protein [Micromonosporaceae bacterium]
MRTEPVRVTARGGSARVPAPRRGWSAEGRPGARPAAARRPAGGGAVKRTRAPQPRQVTGRATVLGLVLLGLLLTYAYPVRIYLSQQAQIATMEADQAAQRRRIASLTEERAKWNDDEYVITQARRRLQMSKPGEVLYIITEDPDAGAGDSTATNATAGQPTDTRPWYGQLWSSVQAADQPRSSG